MRIAFMGTPDFSVPCLRALIESKHDVVGVFCQPDKPVGRKQILTAPPVKAEALAHGLRVLQPVSLRNGAGRLLLEDLQPDLVIVVAYGKILPPDFLSYPKYGCVNVHASLLPRYRGASPIHWAILNGDTQTGVTTMQMDEGMDTGDMLLKEETPVDGKDLEQLHDELAVMGGRLLVKAIDMIERGEIVPEKQNDEEATYAPMISKKDGLIDFTRSAVEIERKVRAYRPWPGAFTYLDEDMLKVWRTAVAEAGDEGACASGDERPGAVIALTDDGIAVQTGNGVILLTEVQSPGKKRMASSDWLRGKNIEINTILGYNKG